MTEDYRIHGMLKSIVQAARTLGHDASEAERKRWRYEFRDDEHSVANLNDEGDPMIFITMDTPDACAAYVNRRCNVAYENAYIDHIMKTYYLGFR